MTKKELKLLFRRDQGCWHCGLDDVTMLVPHHRLNRGMGGSTELDNLSNVVLICARYNQQMEDSAFWAQRAREHGHKLARWQNPEQQPCFDSNTGEWFLLDRVGNKTNIEHIG
jgi:hypothetical protein